MSTTPQSKPSSANSSVTATPRQQQTTQEPAERVLDLLAKLKAERTPTVQAVPGKVVDLTGATVRADHGMTGVKNRQFNDFKDTL